MTNTNTETVTVDVERFLLRAIVTWEKAQAIKGDPRGEYEAGRLLAREVTERRGAVEGICQAADALGLSMTPFQFRLWLRDAHDMTLDTLGRWAPRKERVAYLVRRIEELNESRN